MYRKKDTEDYSHSRLQLSFKQQTVFVTRYIRGEEESTPKVGRDMKQKLEMILASLALLYQKQSSYGTSFNLY